MERGAIHHVIRNRWKGFQRQRLEFKVMCKNVRLLWWRRYTFRRCDVDAQVYSAFYVRQRVLFKIAVLVFQCLAGQAPSYLSDDCRPASDSRPRHHRSSDSLSCVIRCAHNTYGDRCFATAGPRVWNYLPAELQQCSSVRQFKRCLKTFLFGSWDYGALWLFVKQRRIEIVWLTYLLLAIFSCYHVRKEVLI